MRLCLLLYLYFLCIIGHHSITLLITGWDAHTYMHRTRSNLKRWYNRRQQTIWYYVSQDVSAGKYQHCDLLLTKTYAVYFNKQHQHQSFFHPPVLLSGQYHETLVAAACCASTVSKSHHYSAYPKSTSEFVKLPYDG